MLRLPHKAEQLLAAASMIPGILLALYWARKTKDTIPRIAIVAFTYIVTCIGSIVYHSFCAYNPGYHPRWLRLDITCQQLTVYSTAILSPLGISGALLILPLALIIRLADFAHVPSSYVALAAHALSILAMSSVVNMRTATQWFFAFAVYGMKDVIPNSYTIAQTLWHVLCHFNIMASWTDWINCVGIH